MVGGGRGAFIGAVHRIAANIDGQIELVAGAFSSDAEKSKASGADLFLAPDRVYGNYQELVAKEAALPADQRIDFVAIVTPMEEDGSLDLAAFRKLIDWHIAEGTDGIVVVGTTGESPTVDFDEHGLLIETAVRHAADRIPIIAGTGANSTREAIELSKFAKSAGAMMRCGKRAGSSERNSPLSTPRAITARIRLMPREMISRW